MMTTSVRHRTHTVLSLGALALVFTAGILAAGPLNPPAGPVTSTYKTLGEVEPRIAINATNTPGDADSLFKITQPGSYYLTGNITGVVGKHGIEIVASGVTLDLNGFDLVGVPAMGAFDGVRASLIGLSNIAVGNGSVRNWGQDGINLGDLNPVGCRVEGVGASDNVRVGIYVGAIATIARSSGRGGQYGIFARAGATISNCSASNNSVLGINGDPACSLTNCSAYLNTGVGISVNTGCSLTDCASNNNTNDGFATGSGCTLSNCTANTNTGNGILTGGGSTVTNCSAVGNTGDGITVGAGCTVANGAVRQNTLDGIQCLSGCIIRGNTCSSNGTGAGDGAGINAISGDNRIEGNNCSGADRGIDVDIPGNIIIGNTCAGNTINWTIVANNYFGPIIDRSGIATAAVNGPAAAGTLATTDPHANFSY